MDKPHILILAAGQGKRMQSSMPKVLHPVLFRPMIHHVLDLAFRLPHASVSMVIGNGENEVREACAAYKGLEFVVQAERKGTGHAVQMAEGSLKKRGGSVLILSGDVILLTQASVENLLKSHSQAEAACTLLTAKLTDPSIYGRILKDQEGVVKQIREVTDCSSDEKKIGEVNVGVYVFDSDALFKALSQIKDKNKQKEFYLTDTIEILAKEAKGVRAVCLEDSDEMSGINTRFELSNVEFSLQWRVNKEWQLAGVTIMPGHTVIDTRCKFGKEVSVEQGCTIINSEIGDGVVIEAFSRIVDSKVKRGARILQGSYIESSEVGENSKVGPYAHLRPGSILAEGVKIGNFVEVKKSKMGKGSKASHLSYIGDAEIGENANLGCGFITCNFDGKEKHVTVIENDVFVGSDSQTVAPVTIGAGSYVASGTTVTDDVPQDSLVLSRGKQVTKPGYLKKK